MMIIVSGTGQVLLYNIYNGFSSKSNRFVFSKHEALGLSITSSKSLLYVTFRQKIILSDIVIR